MTYKLIWIGTCLVAASLAHSTTKGLNQIVTPDIQGAKSLSVSLQFEHELIGNSQQIQYEYGINKSLEVAVFQGLKPGAFQFACLYNVLSKGPCLATVGFLGWDTQGQHPSPLVVAGYYKANYKLILGAVRPDSRTEGIIGGAYSLSPTISLSSDYQSGRENYSTFGITWTPNSTWQVNPALYYANDGSKSVLPYVVVSYTKQL